MSAPLLQLQGVSKRFGAADGSGALEVLRGVSLQVGEGETLAIIGPSGCGKSTLLNIIGTLDRPDSGHVHLDGEDLSKLDEEELARVRNAKFGFVFQAHHLLPQCSVLENVLVPTLADKARKGVEAEERARALLQRVGLGERLAHWPGQLSGGERQRVAVVRALINQPRVLLADEPTGALDRQSAAGLFDLLLELNKEQRVTLVVVTHALELAARLGRQLELLDGQLRPASPQGP